MEAVSMHVARNAPGCFGAASVFSHDSNVCKACAVYQECGDKSRERLEEIKSTINVSDLLAKHELARKKAISQRPVAEVKKEPVATASNKSVERKTTVSKVVFEIDQDQQAVIARIDNKKAQQQAVVLCKSNMIEVARKELSEGRNPFEESGPKFLQVTCDLLLSGGFTRASLKQSLIDRLSWSDGTAASHVSITCALLTAFHIVQESDEGFVLSPDGDS